VHPVEKKALPPNAAEISTELCAGCAKKPGEATGLLQRRIGNKALVTSIYCNLTPLQKSVKKLLDNFSLYDKLYFTSEAKNKF